MGETGVKHDQGKLEFYLLPWREVGQIVRVLMFGAKKYSPGNWMNVKPKERYWDAAMRHLVARMQGEILDPESLHPHLAHCGCCVLFALWHDNEEEGRK